jgi:hypothetical protein
MSLEGIEGWENPQRGRARETALTAAAAPTPCRKILRSDFIASFIGSSGQTAMKVKRKAVMGQLKDENAPDPLGHPGRLL